MLYISRVLPGERYGVVDTDDGVEEIVTRDKIVAAVLFDKVEIQGVEYFPWRGEYGGIGRISAYQADSGRSGSQAKVKTMLGMDVRVFDGEITYIGVDTKRLPKRAKIKLSQLGQRMDWNVEVHFDGHEDKELIFILDDNIQMIGPGPNHHWSRHQVKWNISDVTDNATVAPVYRYLMASRYTNPMFWQKSVIDKPDRDAYWKQMSLLVIPSWNITESLTQFLDEFPADLKNIQPPADILNGFKDVAHLVKGYIVGQYYFYRSCCEKIKDRKKYGPFTIDEYDWLRERMLKVFNTIEVDCGSNDKLADRLKMYKYAFERYIKYFNPTDEVKVLFVEVCNRAMQFSIDCCRRSGNRCYNSPNKSVDGGCFCDSYLRGR